METMARILFLDQFASLGGGQMVLIELCRIFRDLGWKVTAAFPVGGEVERRIVNLGGVQIHPLPALDLNPGEKNLSDLLAMARFSAGQLGLLKLLNDFDVIYVNGPRLFPLMWALSFLRKNQKFIYHVHLDHSRGQKELILRVLRSPHTSRLIVNSEFTKARLKEHHPDFDRSNKVLMLENGLSPLYADLPFRPPELAGNKLRFVTVGRISPEKGQGFVIDLAKQYPDTTFYLVGAPDFSDKSFSDYLRTQAPQNVIFAGKTLDVPKFIKDNQISAAIVPSQVNESFGLVAIEAMAASCATLVSERGELPNIAKRTGAWTFKDQGELDKAVRRLMAFDEIELGYLIKNQFEAVKQHYAMERFESQVKQLALGLLGPNN